MTYAEAIAAGQLVEWMNAHPCEPMPADADDIRQQREAWERAGRTWECVEQMELFDVAA